MNTHSLRASLPDLGFAREGYLFPLASLPDLGFARDGYLFPLASLPDLGFARDGYLFPLAHVFGTLEFCFQFCFKNFEVFEDLWKFRKSLRFFEIEIT